jgi:hypothetical protein
MSGLIPLLKLIIDSGAVSPIAPTDVTAVTPGDKIPGSCVRADGKLTFPCWQKFIDPAGSNSDWQDYLHDR